MFRILLISLLLAGCEGTKFETGKELIYPITVGTQGTCHAVVFQEGDNETAVRKATAWADQEVANQRTIVGFSLSASGVAVMSCEGVTK